MSEIVRDSDDVIYRRHSKERHRQSRLASHMGNVSVPISYCTYCLYDYCSSDDRLIRPPLTKKATSLIALQDRYCNERELNLRSNTYGTDRRVREEWDTSVLDKKADYVGLFLVCVDDRANKNKLVHCNINLVFWIQIIRS